MFHVPNKGSSVGAQPKVCVKIMNPGTHINIMLKVPNKPPAITLPFLSSTIAVTNWHAPQPKPIVQIRGILPGAHHPRKTPAKIRHIPASAANPQGVGSPHIAGAGFDSAIFYLLFRILKLHFK
jgi:hypothetical protein